MKTTDTNQKKLIDSIQIDRKRLAIFAKGDQQFIQKLIDTFLLSVPEDIDSLKLAIDKKDKAEIGRCAHRLKSGLLIFGIKGLNPLIDLLQHPKGLKDQLFFKEAENFYKSCLVVVKLLQDEVK